MYSRYHGQSDPSIKIPENYSGCAFSDNHTPPVRHFIPPDSARRMEIAKPTAEKREPRSEAFTQDNAPEAPPLPLPAQEASSPAEETLPEKAYNPTPLPFLQGIGFEELLLLGLIVLLAHNEKGNDIVLWLALLLFSG